MNKFIKDMLTGIDGESYDIGRVLWAIAFLVGIGLTIVAYLQGNKFDLQTYGIGVGALLLSGSGGLKLKSKTEPGPKGDGDNG